MPKKGKVQTYETAYARLEEIVSSIEAGGLTLQESVDAYSEGISLVAFCADILDKTEQKILELRKQGEGIFELVDFE
jgi:exodeoxyribonuclease VII small subunit